MEKRCLNNRNSGFSMVEMLAVVGILVILLGISMVSVVRYRDLLKITELDNAAREIYMAAENRAVLLSGARRLSNQVDKSSGKPTTLTEHDWHSDVEELYYVSKANMTEDLLKTGSIDPALQKDGVDFYIVYDKSSGSVTDVFYAESSMDGLMTAGFDAFYSDWAKSRSERLKLKDTMLVGWYNGRAAEGGIFEPDPPKDVPIIRVIIKNEEELTVTVEYENVPAAPNGLSPANLSVKLGDVDLTTITPSSGNAAITAGNGSCTWVLDSLTAGARQFKNLESGITPGDDFTVEATLTPQNGAPFEAVSDSGTDNSLFQKGSGGETARIGYLRHLQNLDTAFSGVTDKKTSAVQTADILCKGNETYGDYDFIPIYNEKLARYNGAGKEIRNLYVSRTKFTGENAHAGLFSRTATGTSALSGGYTFENIRLVNASVSAAKDCSAGALVGKTGTAKLLNCWVYWELDETLKAELIEDAANNKYNYQVNGKYAGGLVGIAGSGTEITRSLAATLVSGTDCAGGLIGGLEDGGEVTVGHSYADCYLTGTGDNSKVAGLVGNVSNTSTVALQNCYAAGYIMGGTKAAGLCLGNGKTTTKNGVYSVMRYPNRTIGDTFTFLTENQKDDNFAEKTYFLYSETKNITLSDGKTISGVSFDDMYADSFVTKMGSLFERKTPTDSHPYELRVPLDIYDYPGLKDLPHYGDWGRELAALSLVYYENGGGTNWVSGIGVRDRELDDGTKNVTVDGYALLLRKEAGDDDKTVSVTFSYLDKDGATQTRTKDYQLKDARKIEVDGDNSNSYYVLPLPDELVNSGYAEEQFFRYISFELKKGGATEVSSKGEAFFNPHFAETVKTARRLNNAGAEGGWDKTSETTYANDLVKAMDEDGDEVKVRTPRHLYDLSKFKEYYNQRHAYRQMRDLDYSTYTGYGLFSEKPYLQQPIGSGKTDPEKGKNDAFEGTYDGGCHMIKGVVPDAKETAERQYAGLFGYSKGTLSNIVYQLDAKNRVDIYLGNSAQDLYVGALAGGSEGTIDNCAVFGVNLRAGASGVRLYVGGLVGWNGGTIRNSAAELAQLSADCLNYASVYAGGLVGENGSSRNIYTSYAVGRISAIVDKTIETARICGFVGWNYGNISNSYAAVDLSSGGDNVEAYGFCGMRTGSQSGNVYLDQGNFTYRGSSYAANYNRTGDKAQSTVYANLTKADSKDPTKSDAVPGMGLGGKVWNKSEDYPYPAAVRDRTGAYIHYGEYPVPMPLGEMGVFYWEKLVNVETGKATYHMSALAVDPKKNTITKQSTLRTDHDDGCVVTDYGYGYYEENKGTNPNTQSVTFSAENIGYTEFVGDSGNNRLRYKPLDQQEKDQQIHIPANFKTNLYVGGGATQAQKDAFEANQKTSDKRSEQAEIDAAAGLKELQPDYVFHCWNSYHEGGRASNHGYLDRVKNATSGLYLFNSTNHSVVDPDGGSFTLKQTGGVRDISVTFGINPQFADSMRVKQQTGFTVTGGASSGKLGTAGNSFRVRCGAQLQEINWYDTCFTDVTLGQGGYETVSRFPYLSSGNNNGKYVWLQTHDIDWVAEGNTYQDANGNTQPGVFMSIAQIKVSGSDLKGWFGGSYNGQNYTIKNLNISRNGGYEPNCMGLFGAVRDAKLENMVLFSETGTDIVTVQGRTDTTGNDAWYAGGVLVGLALDSTISNCSVAGYTIRDETKRARSVQEGNWNKYYYTMGGAIGGLVGMTDMDMEGCTAAAAIEIVCDHSKGGAAAPIRVGGLVGSTTGNVANCYTGGEIVTSILDENGKVVQQARSAAIYAGRLVGGVGMGPFDNSETNTRTVTVSNCYSYLTLPDSGGVVQARYNIGGAGRTNNAPAGTVMVEKDYYYGANVGGGGTSITYRQLAGQDDINPNEDIYALLTGYSRVTSELGGVAVGGRYSYAPESRPELQGLDYPFPTILTQPGNLHVHYGGWPLRGIVRDKGGAHIRLDMFADRSEPEVKQNGDKIETWREHAETLKLSDGVDKGGAWSASVAGDGKDFVDAHIDPATGELTVTAKVPRLSPVTVTVKYKEPGTNGAEYFMNLTVFVSAKVELRPNAVTIFPNDTITVPLSAYGVEPGKTDYKPITGGTLTVEPGVTGLSEPVSAVIDGTASIKLTRGGGKTEDDGQWADVTYTFKKGDYTSEKTVQRIAVNLPSLPESWNEEGTVWTLNFSGYKPTALSANFADADNTPEGFKVEKVKDSEGNLTVVTLTKEKDAEFPAGGVKLTVTLTVPDDFVDAGITHNLTITVPKPAESEKAP